GALDRGPHGVLAAAGGADGRREAAHRPGQPAVEEQAEGAEQDDEDGAERDVAAQLPPGGGGDLGRRDRDDYKGAVAARHLDGEAGGVVEAADRGPGRGQGPVEAGAGGGPP